MSLNYPEIKKDPPVKPENNSNTTGNTTKSGGNPLLGKILGGVFGGLGGLAVIVIVIGTIVGVLFLPFSIVVIAFSLPVLLFKWLIGKLRTNVT